jgi:hypothetical protein
VATIEAGAPAVFVSANDADVATPAVEATTAYDPATEPAVTRTVALPRASVVAAGADGAADAPLAGATKLTDAPAIGLPSASVTVATSAEPNAVDTVVLWPLPLVATMTAAAPAVLVSENVADVAAPLVEAVTA